MTRHPGRNTPSGGLLASNSPTPRRDGARQAQRRFVRGGSQEESGFGELELHEERRSVVARRHVYTGVERRTGVGGLERIPGEVELGRRGHDRDDVLDLRRLERRTLAYGMGDLAIDEDER